MVQVLVYFFSEVLLILPQLTFVSEQRSSPVSCIWYFCVRLFLTHGQTGTTGGSVHVGSGHKEHVGKIHFEAAPTGSFKPGLSPSTQIGTPAIGTDQETIHQALQKYPSVAPSLEKQ